MVVVPELASVEIFEYRVVLGIGGREHHMLRTREFKHEPLKGRQSCSVEMLDDFNNGSSIKTAQPLVSIGERALDQINALPLAFLHPFKTKELFRPLQ